MLACLNEFLIMANGWAMRLWDVGLESAKMEIKADQTRGWLSVPARDGQRNPAATSDSALEDPLCKAFADHGRQTHPTYGPVVPPHPLTCIPLPRSVPTLWFPHPFTLHRHHTLCNKASSHGPSVV
ncbi:hypothetical protein VTJ04DRAFT_10570 [Mycothermus thermophilus]|uniref:uncharacterized protein n=1 Tax=Humicola insolens TaxID=85995 RepID=UPI003743CC69